MRVRSEHGYAMAALLVALAVMSVLLTVLLPAWSTLAKREKEAELVFRGEQYARAIRLFSQRQANALPPTVDVLVREKYLRKKYKDPITGEDFLVVGPGAAVPGMPNQNTPPTNAPRGAGAGQRGATAGAGQRGAAAGTGPRGGAPGGAGGFGTVTTGVAGVVSKSTDTSLRVYNGRTKYNEWVFVPVQRANAAGGARGANQPGAGRGGGGLPGLPPAGGRGAQPPGGRGLQLPQGFGGGRGPGRQ